METNKKEFKGFAAFEKKANELSKQFFKLAWGVWCFIWSIILLGIVGLALFILLH